MCKTSLESARKQGNEKPVGNGINNGILYLLSIPYIAVGSLGGYYYYKVKKRSN
jgi:hypothetical protein